MKNLVYALAFLYLIGCATTTPTYTLKFGRQLSSTQIIFNESPQRTMDFIRRIDTTEMNNGGWTYTERFVNSQTTSDTTYFTMLNISTTKFEELSSGKRLSFQMTSHFDGRLFSTDSGTVVDGLKLTRSNNAIPSSYNKIVRGYGTEKMVGRYVLGGIATTYNEDQDLNNLATVACDLCSRIDKNIVR